MFDYYYDIILNLFYRPAVYSMFDIIIYAECTSDNMVLTYNLYLYTTITLLYYSLYAVIRQHCYIEIFNSWVHQQYISTLQYMIILSFLYSMSK